MSSFPTEGAALKKIIEKSKSREISFGYNPGTDEDDHYFAAHLKKTPEVLGKLARNEGLGAKIAFGTFTTKGNLVSLRCTKVVPMLAKLFKRLLRQNKIGLNVQILDQDGNLLDADVEDLAEDWSADDVAGDAEDDEDADDADGAADDSVIAAADAAVPDAEMAPDSAEDLRRMQALVARVKAVQPRLAAAPPAAAATLAGAMKAALMALRNGDYDRAEQTVSQIEAVLVKLAGNAAAAPAPGPRPSDEAGPDPRLPKLRDAAQALAAQAATLPEALAGPLEAQLQTVQTQIAAGEAEAALGLLRQVQETLRPVLEAKAKWDKAFAVVDPQVVKALSAAAGGGQDLRTKWNFATGLAAEGQYDRALASLAGVVALLRQGVGGGAADAPPAGTVAFQRSRVLWLGARAKMMDEARKLGDQIAAAGADEEDAAEIAAAGQEIVAQVERIDERLQTVLDELTNSPEGRARETLKRQAATVVAEYEAMLGAAPFTMIDQNPFAPVAVASRARAALTAISRSLA